MDLRIRKTQVGSLQLKETQWILVKGRMSLTVVESFPGVSCWAVSAALSCCV